MFQDVHQWNEIRRRVLEEGQSMRAIQRETRLHWKTIRKILDHIEPPGYRQKRARAKPKIGPFLGALHQILEDDNKAHKLRRRTPKQIYSLLREQGYTGSYSSVRDYLAENKLCAIDRGTVLSDLVGRPLRKSRRLLQRLLQVPASDLSTKDLTVIRQELERMRAKRAAKTGAEKSEDPNRWMLRLLQCKEPESAVRAATGEIRDLGSLLKAIRTGGLRDRNKAMAVIAHHGGVSFRSIARFLHMEMRAVSEYCSTYRLFGYERLIRGFYDRTRKADDERLQNTLFAILHTPPKDYDINRTTWRQADLKRVLEAHGHKVARDTIRAIVKEAGYSWKQARVVLTSPDPEYREKLAKIQSILSALGPNDRFFSIDEFGPFAVKIQGGRCLMPPGKVRVVPQRQKSKGRLILTAALELSTNQVTHFYSEKKNTAEMIKLLEVLLVQYAGCDKIYLSWDAASWHASKKLYERVEEVNSAEYRARHKAPHVELAPLPASAQFLNVIESVFSGMAKAIIHHSDYESVEVCKAAIDRYFAERNASFLANPRRAGRIIWGKEATPSRFSASNNCKSPKYHYYGL
jgi:transposase